MTTDPTAQFHGSAVATLGRGCLILGASGSGKSTLAFGMMSYGAELVGDDGITAEMRGGEVWISAQPTLPAAIEVRHVGLLTTPLCGPVPLKLLVFLDHEERDRLPPQRYRSILGCDIPCLHKAAIAHFPFAVFHYLRHVPATV